MVCYGCLHLPSMGGTLFHWEKTIQQTISLSSFTQYGRYSFPLGEKSQRTIRLLQCLYLQPPSPLSHSLHSFPTNPMQTSRSLSVSSVATCCCIHIFTKKTQHKNKLPFFLFFQPINSCIRRQYHRFKQCFIVDPEQEHLYIH